MSDFGSLMEEKCMNLAIRIVNLCTFLNKEKKEFKIADQLFRSATSIGANFAEAQCAISRNDFIAKVYISLKECNESLFWLKLPKSIIRPAPILTMSPILYETVGCTLNAFKDTS